MSSTGPSEPAPSSKQAPTRGEKLSLAIEKIAAQGQGMARRDGIPIFVPGAIPGQEVLVEVTRHRGRYAEGKLLKVLKKAPGEIKPRCKHFWDCGGCVWQHLPYEKQILYKEQIVRETLEHVTPVEERIRRNLPGRVLSIIPSPQVYYYRNKLELSFGYAAMRTEQNPSGRRVYFDENPSIGFHQPGEWATILPITECHLYDEQISALLLKVQDFLEETHLPVYNPKTHRGMLRTLLLRRGIQTGEQMVCFLVQARKRELEPLFQHFLRFGQHPSVTSLLIIEHFGLNERPSPEVLHSNVHQSSHFHVLKGGPTIRERLFDLEFELSPFSFFQTNTLAAEKLYQAIAKAADLSGRETVLDCYCGIGAIGQYLSRFAQKVVGIESVGLAVEDALRSASLNKISNIGFYKGATEDVLRKQLAPGGKYTFDVVIVDPPRAGLHRHALEAILAHHPTKVIYISCNTSTFARDLAGFLQAGYELRMVQPVDLFPHTAHVETVALLQR
jgi:23S rRNA (uracil1939-C5)-methyltransferase